MKQGQNDRDVWQNRMSEIFKQIYLLHFGNTLMTEKEIEKLEQIETLLCKIFLSVEARILNEGELDENS